MVIDPNRDIAQYQQAAARDGRADHPCDRNAHPRRLRCRARASWRAPPGAQLLLSDEGDADWKYGFAGEGRLLRHGDRITIGNIHVDVVHTPGHTPEHLAFLVTDGAAADRPIAAATGDFIFVGDVGRPDLLERAAHMAGTMERSAHTLWHSLRASDALGGVAADLAGPRRRLGLRQGHQRDSPQHARLRAALQLGAGDEERRRVRQRACSRASRSRRSTSP